MVQPLPYTTALDVLPIIAAPKGFRTLPAAHPHEGGTFQSPAGLLVDVMDVIEDGRRYRRLVLSHRQYWPTGDEVDLCLRLFLGAARAYSIEQSFGTGPLRVKIEHAVDGKGSVEGSAAAKAALVEKMAQQNARREALVGLPQAVRRAPPEGWRRRPGPRGPVFDDRAGLQVVLSEQAGDEGERVVLLSVSRVDRMPSEAEALAATEAFLGASVESRVQHPSDPKAAERRILFVSCKVR